MYPMVLQNRSNILKVLRTGSPKKKSFALEKIWEARDVSLVSALVDALEKEKSLAVKERILILLFDRLIPLSELMEVDISSHIDRMLRFPGLFLYPGVIEIFSRPGRSNNMKV
jgi:hypothetical protein